jgi:Protein of unknown function (DUF3562)
MDADQINQSDQYLGIEYLARESHESIEEVAQLLKNEIAKLSIDAHIKTFIPIFALRNIRELLHQRRIGISLRTGLLAPTEI